MSRSSRSPRRSNHPCVFSTAFVREQVDPRVKEAFAASGRKAPFGDLRRQWQREHCQTLNPYTSDTCPYPPEDCALAFLTAVEHAADKASPVGYFRKIARSMALDRSENKPLERDREYTSRPRDERAVEVHPGEGQGLRGPESRPQSIGDLLRALDLGPRQGPADDGKESPQ